jgi:hypothetical protein
VILLSDDILFINELNTFVLSVLRHWHEYKRDRCERADLSLPREGPQSVHQLQQAQKDGVAPKEVLDGDLLDRAISSVLLPPWHQN